MSSEESDAEEKEQVLALHEAAWNNNPVNKKYSGVSEGYLHAQLDSTSKKWSMGWIRLIDCRLQHYPYKGVQILSI